MDIERARIAMKALMVAILDSVAETEPFGAPESLIYLALTEHGLSQDAYNTIIGAMVSSGLLHRSNNLLHLGKRGIRES